LALGFFLDVVYILKKFEKKMRKHIARIKKTAVCQFCGNNYEPKDAEIYCTEECRLEARK
jgi:hypothetical protein